MISWQILGVLPQSFTFREWTFRGYNAPSLDRYLLPLLPLALALLLWALRDVRIVLPAAWVVTLALAIFSIVGTRDFFVFHRSVWEVARTLNAEGVTNTRLDAGVAWDGYHLYEYSVANDIRTSVGAPWWIGLFAPAVTADYIVAGAPRDDFSDNYRPIRRVEYSSWLYPEPVYLYVLRRNDVSGSPQGRVWRAPPPHFGLPDGGVGGGGAVGLRPRRALPSSRLKAPPRSPPAGTGGRGRGRMAVGWGSDRSLQRARC